MPKIENLYPNSKNQPKRVEIPVPARRKSLPKQRKSAEKVEDSMTYHLLFTNSNTVYARNCTVYAKRVF